MNQSKEAAEAVGRQAGKPLRLGELELATLENLWSAQQGSARSIHQDLGTRRGISCNTVQSTLDRLFRKGLVQRRKHGRSFVYQCRISRTELLARRIDDLANELSGGESDAMLAAFVHFTSRLEAGKLSVLERLIFNYRQDRGEGQQ